jgi:outer membrane receptor protein involved in Fe transport
MYSRRRPGRGLTITAALLLSTALAAPAFAEIEEVVVTAQKRSEDIQSVPIAITAFTAQDIKAHQIDEFKDLQFSTPNVSYTKGNFTGSDFQIRGIGITAVGYDAESGVAVHLDDVFLAAPPLAEATFFDLDRIEVLRGPQSTLYGRGATGGTVNIITAKPELDEFHTDLEGSYGNYDYKDVHGMVNVPIVDGELGIRLAGDWLDRDGFVTNVANGDKIDSRNSYSMRGSVRWQPSTRTTIDIVFATEHEGDSRMRAQKQYCSSDPSGTLGCLPYTLSNGLVNLNSTLSTIASSVQGFESAGLPGSLGLYDLSVAPTLPAFCQQAGNPCNPSDPRKVFTDFDPKYRANDTFYTLNWKQNLTPWLDSTLVLGQDHNEVWSQESYNNVAGLTFDPTKLATSEGTALFLFNALGGPAYAANFAPFFLSHPGELPESNTGRLGLISGNIHGYLPGATAFDQSDGLSTQYSAELRFNTNFTGPVNFLLAGYYLNQTTTGDYFVNGPTLDYPSIILGGVSGAPGAGGPSFCATTGCILGPGFYHNVGDRNTLQSKSVFGEVYYDAVPDTLKFTFGLRWTDDEKFQRGRIELYSGLIPLGSSDEQKAMATIVAQGQRDFDCSNGTGVPANCPGAGPGPNDVWQLNSVSYNKVTGRAVADWTPKLDFTDQTLIYLSYARGYKAGGFNPGVESGIGVPTSYAPETIDALELGTKNTLLGGTLQANGDIWYYNYKGLQVSAIENNTSVNQNVNAKLYGVEGEFFWLPQEDLQFNLNFGTTHSSITNSKLIDDRNPTDGRSDVLLVKDATLAPSTGQNCVLYYAGATPGSLPVGFGFFAPPGGVNSLSAAGVPHASYGTCIAGATIIDPETGTTFEQALEAQGFSTMDPTGLKNGNHSGAFDDLSGNQLQNTPDFTISVGAQYTFHVSDYTLVPRIDYYWQTSMFGRIFNDPSDKIKSWGVGNAQITLNAPEGRWYVTAWMKNIANSNNVTGEYLTSSTSGLYTNAFLGDPRTFGVTAGIHF